MTLNNLSHLLYLKYLKFVGPVAVSAMLICGVALGVAVLFVQEGKTILLMPTGVLSECSSLLMGCVGVVARRGKEKHIVSSLDLSCYNVQV